MYIGLHLKHPLYLSEFNETWIFLDRFCTNNQGPNFMKIRPVEAELFYADGQTDTMELIDVFRNFANSSN